jgi:hypothetical protein
MNVVLTRNPPVDSNNDLRTNFKVVRQIGRYRKNKENDSTDLHNFFSSELFQRVLEECQECMKNSECDWEIRDVSLIWLGTITVDIACWNFDYMLYARIYDTLLAELQWEDVNELEIIRTIEFQYCEPAEVPQKVKDAKDLLNFWSIP